MELLSLASQISRIVLFEYSNPIQVSDTNKKKGIIFYENDIIALFTSLFTNINYSTFVYRAYLSAAEQVN